MKGAKGAGLCEELFPNPVDGRDNLGGLLDPSTNTLPSISSSGKDDGG